MLTCDHPWWGQKMHRGDNRRCNLELFAGIAIKGKTQAEVIFEQFVAALRDGSYREPLEGTRNVVTAEGEKLAAGSFSAAMERYIEKHISKLRGHGIEDRARLAMDYFKNRQLASITTGDLEDYWTFLRKPAILVAGQKSERIRSVATVDRYKAMLRTFWKWAIREKLTKTSPFYEQGESIIKNKGGKKRRKRILHAHEEKALRLASKERMCDLITFALETGVRFSEQRMVTFGDTENTPGWLRVQGTDDATGDEINKDGTTRFVKLTDKAAAVVVKLRKGADEQDKPADCVIFSEGDRTAYGNWSQTFKRNVAKAGIPTRGADKLVWHDLRRTFATRLMEDGVALPFIQDQLGHEDVETTMRYIGVTREGLREALDRAEAKRRTVSTGLAHGVETGGAVVPFAKSGTSD